MGQTAHCTTQRLTQNLYYRNNLKIMKKIYYLLFIATIFATACKKDDEKNAKGTLTLGFSVYENGKWVNEPYTATSVKTTKSGNDYTVVATDAAGTSVTLKATGVTGPGKFNFSSVVVRKGVTHTSATGNFTATTATANALSATFQTDAAGLAIMDGKVDATF